MNLSLGQFVSPLCYKALGKNRTSIIARVVHHLEEIEISAVVVTWKIYECVISCQGRTSHAIVRIRVKYKLYNVDCSVQSGNLHCMCNIHVHRKCIV
jgi:hypothetical protein